MIADRTRRACLIILEVVVLATYLALLTLRMSENNLYAIWSP